MAVLGSVSLVNENKWEKKEEGGRGSLQTSQRRQPLDSTVVAAAPCSTRDHLGDDRSEHPGVSRLTCIVIWNIRDWKLIVLEREMWKEVCFFNVMKWMRNSYELFLVRVGQGLEFFNGKLHSCINRVEVAFAISALSFSFFLLVPQHFQNSKYAYWWSLLKPTSVCGKETQDQKTQWI